MSMDKPRAIRFIEAVPEGRWTAYSDAAVACGSNSPRSIGLWLRNSGGTIRNYWRVMTVKGEVPETFVGGGTGTLDALTARELLRREGVWIDADGRARARQRFTVADYMRLRDGAGVPEIQLGRPLGFVLPIEAAEASRAADRWHCTSV